ncbi:hypothetical protein CF087_17875 [Clostridium botulinum]|nr:hypothetical protein [Clostridium botulinum]
MAKLYCVKLETIDKAGLMAERYRNKAQLLDYQLEEINDDKEFDMTLKKIQEYREKAENIENALFNVHGYNKAEWKYIEIFKQAEIELQISM